MSHFNVKVWGPTLLRWTGFPTTKMTALACDCVCGQPERVASTVDVTVLLPSLTLNDVLSSFTITVTIAITIVIFTEMLHRRKTPCVGVGRPCGQAGKLGVNKGGDGLKQCHSKVRGLLWKSSTESTGEPRVVQANTWQGQPTRH